MTSQPFFTIATQNPIEQEGTYPLPEAQLDRFMFNIKVAIRPLPKKSRFLRQPLKRKTGSQKILSARQLLIYRNWLRIAVSEQIVKYAARLVATRPGDEAARPLLKNW